MLTNALLNDGLSNPVQVIRGLLRWLRLLAMTGNQTKCVFEGVATSLTS
jgi:hypothetical protein